MPQQIDLSYYKPANKEQEEFHRSLARHKMLIGGYGGGKTYPAIHEAIFHCLDNPRHDFLVCRNTWDTLEDEVMSDFVRIASDAGLVKELKETKHDLYLINDCKVMFRPLTLGRKNFKGMHICGFLIDDPDVIKYSDDISFLYSRLRNPPNVRAVRFQTIITSNWEGRNWLWKTYMRDREPGGDDKFAYWVCPTTGNPHLPDGYVEDLAAVHSEEWMKRYVHCDLTSHIGLIYSDFDPAKHHIDTLPSDDPDDKRIPFEGRTDLIRILAIDVGGTHPTAILKMATDGQNIYVYDEWYKKGPKLSEVGVYLQEQVRRAHYHKIIIDPSSAKGEQTSNSNVKYELKKNYGIHSKGAENAINAGIKVVQNLFLPADGPIRLFIDVHRCPNLKRELEIYRWKEPRDMDFDEMGYREEPVKKNDHAVDAMRYGVMYLKKYLKGLRNSDFLKEKRKDHQMERLLKLKHYQQYPGLKKKARLMQTYQRLGLDKKRINQLLSADRSN